MKLAERLSAPKASCSLPISAFSIVPNFLVLLASWSGAEASRTHDLKGFSKRRFAVFWFTQAGSSHGKCRISETKREGHFSDKKHPCPCPSQQNSTTRAAQFAAPNRTAVPLPEVHGIFRSRTISVLSLKFPCHPLLQSCICPRGTADWMKTENRSPISSTFRGGRGCGDGDSERFVGKT